MNSTVLQRVNYIIENSNKTKNLVANEIGMSSTTVWRQLKGEQALSAKLVEGVLAVFPEVSAEWLMRGKDNFNFCGNAKVQSGDDADSPWHSRYLELEKRYGQLLSLLGGGFQKANVG